jgi:hypothetical protein
VTKGNEVLFAMFQALETCGTVIRPVTKGNEVLFAMFQALCRNLWRSG